MFSCKDSIGVLMNFLDGELSPEEEAHLREHLEGCPPCIDFLKTYKATPSVCRRHLAKKMPPELSSKLTDYLRERIQSKPPKPSKPTT